MRRFDSPARFRRRRRSHLEAPNRGGLAWPSVIRPRAIVATSPRLSGSSSSSSTGRPLRIDTSVARTPFHSPGGCRSARYPSAAPGDRAERTTPPGVAQGKADHRRAKGATAACGPVATRAFTPCSPLRTKAGIVPVGGVAFLVEATGHCAEEQSCDSGDSHTSMWSGCRAEEE
jgi:hypothetical protein